MIKVPAPIGLDFPEYVSSCYDNIEIETEIVHHWNYNKYRNRGKWALRWQTNVKLQHNET